MTKKVPKKILRIERHFFVNLRKKCFWPPTPRRRRRRRFFGTGGPPPPPTAIDPRPPPPPNHPPPPGLFFWGPGGATPPPTEIDRRAAADTMTSAHSSTMATPCSASWSRRLRSSTRGDFDINRHQCIQLLIDISAWAYRHSGPTTSI